MPFFFLLFTVPCLAVYFSLFFFFGSWWWWRTCTRLRFMWKSFYAEWEGGGQDAAPPTRACVCVYVYLPQRKWGKRGKKLLLSFHFSLSRFVNGEENERRSKESRGNTLLNSKKKKKQKNWTLKSRTERNFKGTFNELPMPSRTVWRGLSKAEHKQRCLFFFFQ